MPTNEGHIDLWQLVVLLLLLWPVAAEADIRDNANLLCSQMLTIRLLDNCCGESKPGYQFHTQNSCQQQKHNYGACRYDCIFKHWQLLHDNDTLDTHRVRTMIGQLYGKHSDHFGYGILLEDAFEQCEHLSFTYAGMVRMFTMISDPVEGDRNAGVTCNRKAYLYAKCIMANMFLNCPEKYWQEDNEDCQASRRLLTYCVRFLHGAAESGNLIAERIQSAAVGRLKRKKGTVTHWYTAFFNWLVF